jgi:transposase
VHEILNAIFYVVRSGCAWRLLPHEFPAWQTAYHHFRLWRLDGTWEHVNTARLNTQSFLPAIQREFVWRPDQIIQLFDSLLRRYPVGSFLFWEVQPENRDKCPG